MKHIYIIEDDVGILEALTFLLETNYLVTAISDGRFALTKLQSEQPDLILLDLLMPGFNGLAFIDAFSRLKLDIPILLMTACRDEDIKIKNFKIAGVIHKPFHIEEIETKIKQLL